MVARALAVTPARNASTSCRLSASAPCIFQLPAIKGLRVTRVSPQGGRYGQRAGSLRAVAAQRNATAAAPPWMAEVPRMHEQIRGRQRSVPEARADGLREPARERVDLLSVFALDHHADDGLRARRPQHDSATLAELRFGSAERLAHGGVAGRINGLADFDVHEHLRELLHARRELAQWPSRATHDGQHLQRRDEPVAGRRSIEANDVTGSLAAEDAALALQHREHVAIADLGAQKLDTQAAQRELEPEVAHDRADHRAAQCSSAASVARQDIEDLVAVDETAALVDHDDAVAVAIERQADVGPHARDRQLQQIGARRAAAVVDV